MAVSQHQHRLRGQVQRAAQDPAVVLGSQGPQSSHDHIDARASRPPLSRRHRQQPDRPLQARRRRSKFRSIRQAMGETVVIGAVKDFADRFLGRGEATIAVPSFDGALKPNQVLESADIVLACAAPEDLACGNGQLYLADGHRLVDLAGSEPRELRSFDAPISAICLMPDGGLAVALAGREVRVYPDPAAQAPSVIFTDPVFCAINALAVAGDGGLIATDGSMQRGVDDWGRDLMELGRSG